MKKVIFSCFTGLLLTWIMDGYSQDSNATTELRSSTSLEKFLYSSEEMEKNTLTYPIPAFINEISTRALRDFAMDYKNASDVIWIKSDNGFAVYFSNDGINTRILYNKRGDRLWVIRDYGEDRLPREIRNIVKSVYYDYSIYLVNEVTAEPRTGYVVKVQAKTSLIEVKIVDGLNGSNE